LLIELEFTFHIVQIKPLKFRAMKTLIYQGLG
jgi:hypothetical protein